MSQSHDVFCDGCGKTIDIAENPEGVQGWLDVRPILADGMERRPVADVARGQFCSYKCLIIWAAARDAQELPTLQFDERTPFVLAGGGRPEPAQVLRALMERNGNDVQGPTNSPERGTGGYL